MIYRHEVEERRARVEFDPGDREMPEFAGPEFYEEQDEYLRGRGLSPKLARANGWYPSLEAGDSKLRIVIPASPSVMNFWQARAIDPREKQRYQSPYGSRGAALIVVFPTKIEHLTVVIVDASARKHVRAGHERHLVVPLHHQDLEFRGGVGSGLRRAASNDHNRRGGPRCCNSHSVQDIVRGA